MIRLCVLHVADDDVDMQESEKPNHCNEDDNGNTETDADTLNECRFALPDPANEETLFRLGDGRCGYQTLPQV